MKTELLTEFKRLFAATTSRSMNPNTEFSHFRRLTGVLKCLLAAKHNLQFRMKREILSEVKELIEAFHDSRPAAAAAIWSKFYIF